MFLRSSAIRSALLLLIAALDARRSTASAARLDDAWRARIDELDRFGKLARVFEDRDGDGVVDIVISSHEGKRVKEQPATRHVPIRLALPKREEVDRLDYGNSG